MPLFAANLNWMFPEWPFAERFAAAADAGFTAIEALVPYELPADVIARELVRHKLTPVLFNTPTGNREAGDRGLAAPPGRFDEFKACIELALRYAKTCGVKRLHVVAGIGERSDPRCVAAYRQSISWAGERLAREGIEVMLEPINRRDIPGFFLNDFGFAADLINELKLPNVKLQFDIYHRQILHGDLIEGLLQLLPITGHIQIAGVPGRYEPDEQCEQNYPFLFAELDRLGYAGYVSGEYRPRTTTLAGLAWFKPYAGNR
jgi:2-dehydrotetronate isomerase